MLSMEHASSEADPTEPFRVIVRQGILSPVESLRRIRERALETLYSAYEQASTLEQRLKVVRATDQAVPSFSPGAHVSDDIWAWLEPDCVNTAHFFSDTVIPDAELPVIDTVAHWLRRVRRFGRCQAEQMEHLGQQLADHGPFQLYRMLIGWYRWDEEDEQPDWRRGDERRREAVDRYLETLNLDTMDRAVRELAAMAEQAHAAGETGMNWFNTLLRDLGRTRPALATQFVEQVLAEDLVLKPHLGFVIAGLRECAPETALNYARLWVAEDDAILWRTLATSYRFVEWESLPAEEWDILRDLVGRDCSPVDYEVLSFIWQWAPCNPAFAVDLLKHMAARGDERLLSQVAMALVWPNENRDGWAVEFEDSQDYLDIIQHFERLTSLDFYTEQSLNRLGQIDPMHVIDFMERRISAAAERRSQDERYNAIPFRFSEPMDTIRLGSEHLDAVRRVRDWMLRDNPWFRFYTPYVLRAISPGLGGPLYDVLLEWVQSGDGEKLVAVVAIVHDFNVGDEFYALVREIIRRTDDDSVVSSLSGAIGATPGVISGPMSEFIRQRMQAVSPWLEDDDYRVRDFAQRMLRTLQMDLEREEAAEELERRQW
jgi:hypothetical protein